MYSFPNLEPVCGTSSMSGSNCCILTCIQISQEAGQMVWDSHLFKNFPPFVVIHKGFGIVNEAEVDVFFWNSLAFFSDPMDVGNLISGSSAFSKASLNIWNFTFHTLLKPGLENFEHYFAIAKKARLVKAMVFPGVMYGYESWTVKKAEHWKIDAFELWCWRKLLRVPWSARRSNQSILKEISPGCLLEGLMLKLKVQYFGHLMRRVDSL